ENGAAESVTIRRTPDQYAGRIRQAARTHFDGAVSLPVVDVACTADKELFFYISTRSKVDWRLIDVRRHERMGLGCRCDWASGFRNRYRHALRGSLRHSHSRDHDHECDSRNQRFHHPFPPLTLIQRREDVTANFGLGNSGTDV